MKKLPSLPISTIWMLSFGFLGIQMAFSLQSSQMSRIFATLGADPHSFGWFFLLPPLAGLIVQPIVGYFSDKTWLPKLGGRRLPYLIYGAIIAAIVMILLPNSGGLGLAYANALLFGALMIALLDVSSNMAMQPFKMMVGDMVNKTQKGYAYGIQSFFTNTGAVVASVLPFVFAYIGLANTAPKGIVPQTVVVAFYVGAGLLILTSALTVIKVKEYDPPTYAKYHNLKEVKPKNSPSFITLLANAPREFWTISLVQFFCWFDFQYLWTYTTGGIAQNVWNTQDPTQSAYQEAGNWFGVLSAVQGISAVICSFVLAKISNEKHKIAYFVTLLLGAIGFLSIYLFTNANALILSFILIGICWAGIITYPLTFVTNALQDSSKGANMGTYLGLFNGSICLPQIAASLLSFVIFPALGSSQINMMLISALALLLGSLSVFLIKNSYKNAN
ncbi:MAG: SLC45 family MFS transporter [Helicobacter sp.]|nr:SLC45 family MFS transporter [Helicobacter sp.]